MKIQFYGRLAERFGRHVELDIQSECSVAELRRRLAADFPGFADVPGKRVRACIGDTIVADTHLVRPGETVEFLPPVSGG
ncbi:MAG: MoaD/ThiS family protein [Alphaproteobacteria bacterium]